MAQIKREHVRNLRELADQFHRHQVQLAWAARHNPESANEPAPDWLGEVSETLRQVSVTLGEQARIIEEALSYLEPLYNARPREP